MASAAKNNNQRVASVVVADYFSQVLFPTAEWKDELAANLLKHFKVLFFSLPLHQHHQIPEAFEDQFANHKRAGDTIERLSFDEHKHFFI